VRKVTREPVGGAAMIAWLSNPASRRSSPHASLDRVGTWAI